MGVGLEAGDDGSRQRALDQLLDVAQELVLEGTPAAQAAFRGKESLTIEGSLDYQACDDKVCFNPVSVPLTWTMNLKTLVTERAPQRQP